MHVVVEISREDYESLKRKDKLNDMHLNHYEKLIVNGKPLPKGHGRIGDLDKLSTDLECGIRAGNYEEGYEKYPHINNMDDCIDAVKYADTIIEADTEEEE